MPSTLYLFGKTSRIESLIRQIAVLKCLHFKFQYILNTEILNSDEKLGALTKDYLKPLLKI